MQVGDTVVYSAFGGERRLVRVTGFGEKNGKPLFDDVLLARGASVGVGESVWGYFSQVVLVCTVSDNLLRPVTEPDIT